MIALVAQAWAIAAALQLLLWLVQLRTHNAGIVDVGWALSFALVIALFAARATTDITAWGPLAAVASLWSLRLGSYLISRGAARSPEEGRYVDLRARWAPHAARRFFVFFQAQAALTGILSLAFVVPFVLEPHALWPRIAGIVLSVVGVAGETIADAQLARWKRERRGPVCDAGLWGYSRHPNYFFEWCVWLGYAVYGLAFCPWGLIAIGPQALLLFSLLFVTGIPPTEKQAIRSKGDAYRATSSACRGSSRFRGSARERGVAALTIPDSLSRLSQPVAGPLLSPGVRLAGPTRSSGAAASARYRRPRAGASRSRQFAFSARAIRAGSPDARSWLAR